MKVFTTGQVAAICKVAPRTVSKWFDAGRLKGYRIPGSQDRRIPAPYLMQFLRENSMPTHELEGMDTIRTVALSKDQTLIGQLKLAIETAPAFAFASASNSFNMGMLLRDKPTDAVIIDFAIGDEAIQVCESIQTQLDQVSTYVMAIDPPAVVNRSGISETVKRPIDAKLIAERIESVIGPRKELV